MGERCMCVFTGCSHTCVKCVFFFFSFYQGLIACVCFLQQWGACVNSKPSHFFFPQAWHHFLVPPSAQTPSLFLWRFFFFSSAVHWFRLRLPLPFLCLFRIHYPDFFSPRLCSRIHKPQQFQIPWLCTFSKPHLKKQVDHTPPTYEIILGK